MGCMSSKQLLFKVLMANEAGKYDISGYLLFRESQDNDCPAIRSSHGEPELVLLNHWKEDMARESRSFSWKISQIKTYGYCHGTFMFECRATAPPVTSNGSMQVACSRNLTRSARGAGTRFLFKTPQARQIFKLLQLWCHEEALKMERGFDSTVWGRHEDNMAVCQMSASGERSLIRARSDLCSEDGDGVQLVRVECGGDESLYRPRKAVRNRYVEDFNNESKRDSSRRSFNWQEPIQEEDGESAHAITNYQTGLYMNESLVTHARGPTQKRRGEYSKIVDRNNNNSFANPCVGDEQNSNIYSALQSSCHTAEDEQAASKQNASASYVNYIRPKSSSPLAEYCNIDTLSSSRGPESSGISTGSSSNVNFFEFPDENVANNGQNNAIVEIHGNESSCNSKSGKLSIIYSELDSSVCSSSAFDVENRKRSRSLASRDTNSLIERKRRSDPSVEVSYYQLDVEKTRALATTTESRKAENKLRERMAMLNSQGSDLQGETTSKKFASNLYTRRSWSNSTTREKRTTLSSAAYWTGSCLSMRSFRRSRFRKGDRFSG